MKIFAVNSFAQLKRNNNEKNVSANNLNNYENRNELYSKVDPLAFRAAKLKDTMIMGKTSRLDRIATVYMDALESIAMKLKNKGVSFCREFCELNAIKSSESCCSKILRSSSVDIRDRLRATLFVKDITDLSILNDIFDELRFRGLVVSKDPISVNDLINKGYIPRKTDKEYVSVPDLDIRLAEGRENMNQLPAEYKYSFGKPQKSGYEDIQMRLVRAYDDKKNPVKHELIIITGEQYAIAKHLEHKYVYSNTRRLDELAILKRFDDNNEQIKLIKRYIDLIKQMCSVEISQKLFENAKNKDVYNIDNNVGIRVTEKEIETIKNYFENLRQNINIYYNKQKSLAYDDKKVKYYLTKETKQVIDVVNSIENDLIKSIKEVNKGKFPKTINELIDEIKKERKAKLKN